jgi:hypothetical protein
MSAGKAYQNAAANFQKAKSESEVAQCFIEAARCFIKSGDTATATALLETEALPRMVDAGRLSQAAKLHEEVAGMFESEGAHAPAMENYQKAADLFSAENAGSTASKCLARVAHLAAQLDPPDYEKAAEVFAQVGSDCMSSNLMKFSAKGYFLQAMLCILARGDIVAAESQFERFKELDYTFEGARRPCGRGGSAPTSLTLPPPPSPPQGAARASWPRTCALRSRMAMATPLATRFTTTTRSASLTRGRPTFCSRSSRRSRAARAARAATATASCSADRGGLLHEHI